VHFVHDISATRSMHFFVHKVHATSPRCEKRGVW